MTADDQGAPSHGSTDSRNLAPFFRYDFDPVKHRVHTHYSGFWSEQVAVRALTAFRSALRVTSSGNRPITLLDDCRDWPTQSKVVAEITERFVEICREFPIKRNAMIVPSALVRMQVRRTLVDFDICEIFTTFEEADAWLAEVEPGVTP